MAAKGHGTTSRGLFGVVREGALQADTAVRAAANALTFGQADKLDAAMSANFSDRGTWRQRYEAALAEDQARDAYDASHRQVAQRIGEAGGLALTLLAPEGAPAIIPRIKDAAQLSARELAAILGGTGAFGMGTQFATDAATGKTTSPGDALGAGVGGIAGGLALPFGPARAGAVDGAVTSAAQDLLNRRPISLEDAGQSAAAGRVIAGVAGRYGRDWSNNLSRREKGRLGEAMGAVRSDVNGMKREVGPKTQELIPGTNKRTIPDGRSGDMLFEDKFGYSASLSRNQKLAAEVFGPNYTIYHFVPEDVGNVVALPAAALTPRFVVDRDDVFRKRRR